MMVSLGPIPRLLIFRKAASGSQTDCLVLNSTDPLHFEGDQEPDGLRYCKMYLGHPNRQQQVRSRAASKVDFNNRMLDYLSNE
jgi:hypothetical protein